MSLEKEELKHELKHELMTVWQNGSGYSLINYWGRPYRFLSRIERRSLNRKKLRFV